MKIRAFAPLTATLDLSPTDCLLLADALAEARWRDASPIAYAGLTIMRPRKGDAISLAGRARSPRAVPKTARPVPETGDTGLVTAGQWDAMLASSTGCRYEKGVQR